MQDFRDYTSDGPIHIIYILCDPFHLQRQDGGLWMASSEKVEEVNHVMRTKEAAKKDDLVNGITDGLEDFVEGRYKHFKNDDELEAYLMSL